MSVVEPIADYATPKEILMLTTLANALPILGDYVYIGGGIITLIVIVLLVMLFMRR